jgi:hypothetical protein
MKIHPDILVYIQKVRNYFDTNEDAKKYFKIHENETLFYDLLIDMSKKNYDKNNEPMLTIEQFEELRMKLLTETFKIENNDDSSIYQVISTIDIPELSKICLN